MYSASINIQIELYGVFISAIMLFCLIIKFW